MTWTKENLQTTIDNVPCAVFVLESHKSAQVWKRKKKRKRKKGKKQ